MSVTGSNKLDYIEEKILQAIQSLGPMTESQLIEHITEQSTKYGGYQGISPEKVPDLALSTVRSLIKKGLVRKVSMLEASKVSKVKTSMKDEARVVRGKLTGISKSDRMLSFVPNGDDNKWPEAYPLSHAVPLPGEDNIEDMFRFKIVDDKIVEITPA